MAAYFRSVKPLALAGGLFLTSGAVYLTRRTGTVQCSPSAAITFYQYQTCPFCSKTRAALDYYGINYKTVEVNPLFRREIKFSEYKKVPILKIGNTQQINDSSLIVSVLRSCMIQRANVDEVLQMYPEVTYFDGKNREVIERANKYFLMYGEIPTTTETYGKLR
jgi:microsomal prostaglandin-E synthase 2